MKGDFSRFIFDPKRHYTSALMQQGRVLSDADWNVQQSINQYRFETEAQDVIGLCGVPEDVGGFKIDELLIFSFETEKRDWDLTISPGRIYISGILCELEERQSVAAIELVTDDDPGSGAGVGVKVSALTTDGQEFGKNQWIEIFGKDLLTARCLISEVEPESKVLKFAQVNRLSNTYVNNFSQGSDRRVRRIATYTSQSDYPNPDLVSPPDNISPATLNLEFNKAYLVYIDVWQWHRTSLDDPRIREVALGGPDTTTHLQTIWQVRMLQVDVEVAAFNPQPTLNFLASLRDKLLNLVRQLIQTGNRETASVINSIPSTITPFLNGFQNIPTKSQPECLRSLLEEVKSGLEGLIQLANELGLAGVGELPADLVAVKAEIEKLTVPPQSAPCKLTYPEWDRLTAVSTGTLNARTQTPQGDENPCLLPPTAGYQRLENQLYRVEIHQGGLFKSGTADTVAVKWSRDNGSVVTGIEKISGQEITVQTVGPDDVLGFANGQWVEIIDDRIELNGQPGELRQIANLDPTTRVITLQSAPTPLLTSNPDGVDRARHPKLRRWDSAGALPIDSGWTSLEGGIEVQFSEGTYKTGDYWLIPARTITGEIEWPPYEVPNTNPISQSPLGIEHHYCRLAILKFEEEQSETPDVTIQKLTILEDCRQLFPPLTKVKVDSGIHITEVSVLDADNQAVPLKNDTEILFEMLAKELRIVCDRPIDPQVFSSNNQLSQLHPACFITINLPFPTSQVDKSFWDVNLSFGYQPVILSAETEVDGNMIFWRPIPTVGEWLGSLRERLQVLPEFRGVENVRVLVGLTLKGNFIWAADDPKIYLDGEAFGTRNGETISNLRLPSGDGRRGGDFEMWFWLAPPPPPRLMNLQVAPPSIGNGGRPKGTVILDKPAPEGGIEVSLRIDSQGENTRVSILPSVRVAAGNITAEFEIDASNSEVPDNTSEEVNITASLATDQRTAQLRILGQRLA